MGVQFDVAKFSKINSTLLRKARDLTHLRYARKGSKLLETHPSYEISIGAAFREVQEMLVVAPSCGYTTQAWQSTTHPLVFESKGELP